VCALVPQPGYLTAEVDVKNQMLSEPAKASFVWFRQRSHLSGRRGTRTQKLFWFLFQLGQKGTQGIFDTAQHKIKECFE